MQHLCPNCGDPVDPDEIFCDKCGTRVAPDVSQFQTPVPPPYQGQFQPTTPNPYQAPTPGIYQDRYQPAASNTFQNQYAYNPGQQAGPSFNSTSGQPQDIRTRKILIGIIAAISILALILTVYFIIASASKGKKVDTPNVNPTGAVSPADNNTKKGTVEWEATTYAEATFDSQTNSVNVDYKITLKNIGDTAAEKVNLYFNPEEGDEDAEVALVKPRTVINESGTVSKIEVGQSDIITNTFKYTGVEPSITQADLKTLATIYSKLTVLVEYQMNGKTFTSTITMQ
jgi:hypothetical protein